MKLIPELRFPEFEKDEWKIEKIGDLLAESRIASSKNDPNNRITVRLGLNGVEKREVRGTESKNATYFFVRKKGQFIYGKQNLHKGAFGLIPDVLDGFESSQDIPAFDFNQGVVSKYFLYYLSQENVYPQLELIATGTGSKRIHPRDLFQVNIPIPKPDEQQKIASCLFSLDELINAHKDKLEALKDHKKGLLQNLFPQEGETVPKVRFPEFQGDGEWIETTLEQVADYENGKAHEKDIDENGDFIVANSKFISTEGETVKYTSTAYCPANLGDILMVLSDVPNGKAIAKCFYVDEENRYSVNQRICRITATDCDSRFLFYIMDKNAYFLSFDDGVKQTNLRKSDVLEFPFRISTDPVEQTKIASCISAINELIKAQTLKIEELNQHKRGLMQGLFPKIER